MSDSLAVIEAGYAGLVDGGEGGIRTPGKVAPTLVFETSPFDRSGTSPRRSRGGKATGAGRRTQRTAIGSASALGLETGFPRVCGSRGVERRSTAGGQAAGDVRHELVGPLLDVGEGRARTV